PATMSFAIKVEVTFSVTGVINWFPIVLFFYDRFTVQTRQYGFLQSFDLFVLSHLFGLHVAQLCL
ncbi:MAG: hypothetical protein ACOVRN_15815, partial [Flavobacterium sp.]